MGDLERHSIDIASVNLRDMDRSLDYVLGEVLPGRGGRYGMGDAVVADGPSAHSALTFDDERADFDSADGCARSCDQDNCFSMCVGHPLTLLFSSMSVIRTRPHCLARQEVTLIGVCRAKQICYPRQRISNHD
jgi:hypothetical protein